MSPHILQVFLVFWLSQCTNYVCSSLDSTFPISDVFRVKRASITTGYELILDKDCKKVVSQICPHLEGKVDDFEVIDCLHSYKHDMKKQPFFDIELNYAKCQSKVSEFVSNLLQDTNMDLAADKYCKSDDLLNNCKRRGSPQMNLLLCLINSISDVKDKECLSFLQRLKILIFSDYKAISALLDDCPKEISRLDCSTKRQSNPDDSATSTLSCLQNKLDQIESDECKNQVLHLSELQAEDIKFNKNLFVYCTQERVQYCKDMSIATDQIYQCLMQHKSEHFSTKCADELLKHEQLIVRDYQVSRGLVRACKEDIRAHKCRRLVSDFREIRLVQILLCLENVTRSGFRITAECTAEMLAHRKILMEDFRLSPELVANCHRDIEHFCGHAGVGGRTIHCLMEHSKSLRKKDKLEPVCQRELELLLKETGAAEDWRIDPVLRRACHSFVDIACSTNDIRAGDAQIISCLMSRLGTNMMPEECETALLQIQYFVSRDYKLDPPLYRACHKDAVKICRASPVWQAVVSSTAPDMGPMVLSCLYSHFDSQLSRACRDELSRVMRQRALSVELQPEIEQACLDDLSVYCLNRTAKREEILCLQDHLEQLGKSCKKAVSDFTELQSVHIELNPIITTNCHQVINLLCQNEYDNGNAGDVMDCLIEHKNDLRMKDVPKCRASVEHHQLISLKDYHFTLKFKEACKLVVSRYCHTATSKAEVVQCLSELVRNDTIQEVKQKVGRECRQQLRAQLLQQRENIDLDPRIKVACAQSINKFCNGVTRGNAQVLECLESHRKLLDDSCQRIIFNIERQDLTDSSTDYTLLNSCKTMIIKYCPNYNTSLVLDCLKKFKYEPDFDGKCRTTVVKRMLDQNTDYRLNPGIKRHCSSDITTHCMNVLTKSERNSIDSSEPQGAVIRCLKNKFKMRKLSSECEQQMAQFLKEAALNYKVNPVIATLCEHEIQRLCPNEERKDETMGEGGVEECLKKALLAGQLTYKPCKLEVVELIQEGKADIQADPLLFRACLSDITQYCSEVPKGAGRQLDCLFTIYRRESQRLQPMCQTMLKQRNEMYKIPTMEKQVAGFRELVDVVNQSPSRKYLMVIVLTMAGMLFIAGLFCGRVMKRTTAHKNK